MKKDFKHTVCLIAVFLIGNMIISFPKGEGQRGSLWGFFICLAFSFLLVLFYSYLQSYNGFSLNMFSNSSLLSLFSLFAVLTLCLFSYIVCCKEYIVLVDTLRLNNTSRFLIAPVFILLTALLSTSKTKLVKSFSLVSFAVVLICSIFMFLLSVSQSKPNLFYSALPIDIKQNFIQALTYFIHSFGQIIIVLLFIGKKSRASSKKLLLLGISAGSAVFFICLLQVLFHLGPFVTELLDFPYAAATGSVTAAKSYSRLDGFTYYIYFICSLIKASVIFASAIKAAKSKNKYLYYTVFTLFTATAFLFSTIKPLYNFISGKTFNLVFLCLEIIVPVLLLLQLKRLKTPLQYRHTA